MNQSIKMTMIYALISFLQFCFMVHKSKDDYFPRVVLIKIVWCVKTCWYYCYYSSMIHLQVELQGRMLDLHVAQQEALETVEPCLWNEINQPNKMGKLHRENKCCLKKNLFQPNYSLLFSLLLLPTNDQLERSFIVPTVGQSLKELVEFRMCLSHSRWH